ncbi:hypothetical protein [Planotetraspora kaengkrachanensis]|uniref:Uncharacterized protein n=1 Tax=Planotetraspora kaengkrachanensis TaxID=575193 RepID=A0A8J3PVK2_9ACTN|nr:hypothetical protein [Planotetraspora kaengkrachanensis]GIG81753.1 hypothetical protein Pka01_48800 [Planotetraspora kaengkrachanensis]
MATSKQAAGGGEVVVELALPSWMGAGLLRRHALSLVAAALVAVQLVWKGVLLGRSFFWGDDYAYIVRAMEHPFNWDYLTSLYGPKLLPVGFAVVWGVSRADVYNWVLAASVLLVLQVAASFAVYRLLRVLFGPRPAILVPFGLYLFTPLTVPALLWWAAGLEAVPLQLTLALALTSHVLYLRSGRMRHVAAAAFWFLMALGSFFLKAAGAFPILALVVTAGYFGGVRTTLVRHLRAWLVYAAVLAACAVFFALGLDTSDQPVGFPSFSETAAFAGTLLGKVFPALALGGPIDWYGGLAVPPDLLLTSSWLVFAVLIVVTLRCRRAAGWAWAGLVVYLVVVDFVPVVLGRGHYSSQALEPRYLADTALALALCLALATLPVRDEREPYRRVFPAGRAAAAAGVFAGACLLLSVVSVERFTSGFEARADRDRNYLATAQRTLATLPPGTQLYPHALPDDVVFYGFGEANLSSHVLGPLAPPDVRAMMRDPQPSVDPKVLDEDGNLAAMRPFGGQARAPGGGCFPRMGSTMTIPIATKGDYALAGFSYLHASGGPATVLMGSTRVDVTLPAGDHVMYFMTRAKGTEMQVTTAQDLCVTGGVVGVAVPPTEG